MASRPKTGDKRKRNRQLNMDRLPASVHDAILALRSKGKTWPEIEALSHEFVKWEELPTETLELFPNLRIPHTTLHRWYDLRVVQVKKEVLHAAASAREIANAFAAAGMPNSDEAVLNAARDVIFGLLQAGDEKSRMNAAKGLIALAEVMQAARGNDIKERKVTVDERKLKALEAREELQRRKLEAESEKLKKKHAKGELTQTDLDRLRERVFGLPPAEKHA